MKLQMLEGGRTWDDEPFEVGPFSLQLQPQRPGEICEALRPAWPDEQLDAPRALAAGARLPLALWLTVTVESERALAHVAQQLDLERDVVAAAADDAASNAPVPAIRPMAARRLADYAAALRSGDAHFAVADKRPVTLSVPHTILAAWALAAAAAGETLESWVAASELPKGRHLWEAAAAEQGQQLEAWLFVQAASAARLRST